MDESERQKFDAWWQDAKAQHSASYKHGQWQAWQARAALAKKAVDEKALALALDVGDLAYRDTEGDLEKAIKEAVYMYVDEVGNPVRSGLNGAKYIEVAARAIAVSIYHSEGLETMNYAGEKDYAEREWKHYAPQALAAIKAIERGVESCE